MAVQMRQLERMKDKVEIQLDTRQIGWLVGGCLVIAGAVFLAGYHLGQSSQPSVTEAAGQNAVLAHTAAPATEQAVDQLPAASEGAAAAAVAGEEDEAAGQPKLRYTYDSVLTAPTAPAKLQDPTLEIIAAAKDRLLEEREVPAGGDRALAGPRPAPADEPPKANTALAGLAVTPQQNLPTIDPAPIKPVEAPAADKATPAPVAEKKAEAGYTIQVKAFRHSKEAKQFMAALREAGYKPYLLAADVPGKGRFYRVRLGKFQTLDNATLRQEAFEKAEGFSTIVTPL